MTTADSGGHGPITAEVFARFIRCELEAYLHSRETLGADREFADWRYRSRDRYKQAALTVLQSRYSDNEIHVGMPVAAALKQRRWRLIIDGIAATPMLRACVDAAELARSAKNGHTSYYRPIRFAPADKVGKSDKLLLAFDALALSRVTGDGAAHWPNCPRTSVRKSHAPPRPADPRGQIGARQDCRSTSPNCATTAGAEQALHRVRIPLQMPSRCSREG